MNGSESQAYGRELALTLADTLGSALTHGASPAAWIVARDATQLLGLDGLDRALAACEPHAGHTFPADIAALAERLTRLVAQCREAGDVSVFRDRDLELKALAQEAAGFEWSEPEAGSSEGVAAIATLGVFEVLEEVTLANDESHAVARRSRLTVPVAAALRAALDWLCPHPSPAAVRLLGEPSSLEIRLDRVRHDRLTASHRVIAAVGGNLGPAVEADRTDWIIRVPGHASRVTYLTLVRGGVSIAIPWHAVLKIRMVPAREVVASDPPLEHELLEGIAPPAAPAAEHPVVLIGHGLKRGYLPVDRIVWRMTADACEAPADPPAGLRESVLSEDGESFWVADPASLLEAVRVPTFDAPPAPPAPPAPQGPEPPATPEPPQLTPHDVVALPEPIAVPNPPEASPKPIVMTMPNASNDPGADPLPAAGDLPLALIAVGSITARVFLSHLLEQQGFAVAIVSTRAQLLTRLPERSWALVLSDVELPDTQGADGLRDARELASAQARPATVVALVRDRSDIDAARSAGIEHTLLKPVVRDALVALIARLSVGGTPS